METSPERVQRRPAIWFNRLPRVDPNLIRFIRFGVVGGSGVAVNLAALWFFHKELNLALELAGVLAVSAAIVNNFLWNNFWTFGASGVHPRRVAQFVTISLIGMAINVGILRGLVRLGTHYLAADLLGILVATSWNFFANTRWTWADAV